MAGDAWLADAIVQKVERLDEEAVLLTVRAPGRTVFLLVLFGGAPAVGEIERPSRKPASPLQKAASQKALGGATAHTMRLRRLLEGARVVSLRARAEWFRLSFRRGEERPALVVTPGSLAIVDVDPSGEEADGLVVEAKSARDAYDAHLRARFEADRRRLLAAIEGQRKKLARRLQAIEGDLAKIASADGWKKQATLLVTNLHAIARGKSEVTLDDWSSGEPVPTPVALDPSKSAKENADALFHRAKRLEKGRAVAEGRRLETEKAMATLARLRDDVAVAESLAAVQARAAALGISTSAAPRAKQEPEERLPFTTFTSGARPIYVGRGAKDNDALTTKIARPRDLWLHAKGWPGAHVVVPMEKNEAPAPDLLIDAAHLAAHFSDARGEAVVEVQWTERRYVRKPRGAAPGAVNLDREKVIVLRVEPERLARLLATKLVSA